LDASCVAQGNCDDGRDCNANYCEEDVCVTLPLSDCHGCEKVEDCPAAGDCRVASCVEKDQTSLCEYTYKNCLDRDKCTVDYCMDDTCVNEVFSPISFETQNPTCVRGQPEELFTIGLLVLEDTWSKESLLEVLRNCGSLGGRLAASGSIAIPTFENVGDGMVEVNVVIFGNPTDDIINLGATFVQLIETGVCEENLASSLKEYWAWSNCVSGPSHNCFCC